MKTALQETENRPYKVSKGLYEAILKAEEEPTSGEPASDSEERP